MNQSNFVYRTRFLPKYGTKGVCAANGAGVRPKTRNDSKPTSIVDTRKPRIRMGTPRWRRGGDRPSPESYTGWARSKARASGGRPVHWGLPSRVVPMEDTWRCWRGDGTPAECSNVEANRDGS